MGVPIFVFMRSAKDTGRLLRLLVYLGSFGTGTSSDGERHRWDLGGEIYVGRYYKGVAEREVTDQNKQHAEDTILRIYL